MQTAQVSKDQKRRHDGQRMKSDRNSNFILSSYLQTKQYSVT